jgi:dolichyl-phosphate-mannose-protein mannosyltransferase
MRSERPSRPATHPYSCAVTVTEEPRRTQGLSWTADNRVVPSAVRRMVPLITGSNRLVGWLGTFGITAIAALMRFHNLGKTHKFLFDETYYAKDAWSLINNGYVLNYVGTGDEANKKILAGNLDGLWKAHDPSMIVHPEVGKYLIGIGEHFWGMNPEGWRIASAVAGSLMVMVIIRLVRRMTGSTLLGCTAGVLLCFDGLQFVMSRLALLDIFMALFILCAVSCLVADRDWGRARLAKLVDPQARLKPGDWGPVRGMRWRPWRLAAGLLFGLALGTKWTAIVPLAVFGLWVLFQDAGARRALGVRLSLVKAAVADGIPAFFYLVVVALVVYLASWTGWLLHAHEYDKALANSGYGPYWGDYTKHDPKGFWDSLTQGLRSLYHYHRTVLNFHDQGLKDATHIYQSTPQGWPLINRPVGVDADLGIKPGSQGCGAAAGSTCLRQIILLGTPILWWGGAAAMVYAVYGWLVRRDWRFGVAVLGFASTWLIWIKYDDRPIFYYYAVAMIPFTVIGITLLVGTLIGGPRASYSRRAWGTAVSGAFVVLVVANFAWFYPIYTDALLTNKEWLDRIWFRRWI